MPAMPENLQLRVIAHGHGARGMAFYEYEDLQGLGIVLDARRASRREGFVETWRCRWLPEREFRTYAGLAQALRQLSAQEIAQEKARWPVRIDPISELPAQSGSCWLHPQRSATHRGYARTCWIACAGEVAFLCAECAAAAESDVAVITRACAQRRADCAARQSKREP